MNSFEIDCLLRKTLSTNAVNFLGVFPKDKVAGLRDSHTSYPLCFVANTDVSSAPGTHWVAFYFADRIHCEFWDSFAQSPSLYGFESSDPNLVVNQNTVQVQSFDANECGHHCITFLYLRTHGRSLPQVIETYTNIMTAQSFADKFARSFVENLKSHAGPDCEPDSCPSFISRFILT